MEKKTQSAGTKPLTPAVFYTLLALANGPLHGYAISREVESLTDGDLRMGPGTLYGSLQRILHADLVEESESSDVTAGPHAARRRYYDLTPAGRLALETEVHRLERAVRAARTRVVLGNT